MFRRTLYNFIINSRKGTDSMSEYVFKMKKGDIEIELKSDDSKFIEEQLDKWRDALIKA